MMVTMDRSAEVRRIPATGDRATISPEMEFALAARWRNHGDVEARNKLVEAHRRFAYKLAEPYVREGRDRRDLCQAAVIGLMQALDRFDPAREIRFISFARRHIEAEIKQQVLRNTAAVSLPTGGPQRRVFLGWGRLRTEILTAMPGASEAEVIEEAARRLRMCPDDLLVLVRARFAAVSTDAPVSVDHDGGIRGTFGDSLVDPDAPSEETVAERSHLERRKALLREAVAALAERDRAIFVARYLDEEVCELKELAERFGITRQRVDQIAHRALRQVTDAVSRMDARSRPVRH